jgi:hypothetical protein
MRIELKRALAALNDAAERAQTENSTATSPKGSMSMQAHKRDGGRQSVGESPRIRGMTNSRAGGMRAEEPTSKGGCSLIKVLMARWTQSQK